MSISIQSTLTKVGASALVEFSGRARAIDEAAPGNQVQTALKAFIAAEGVAPESLILDFSRVQGSETLHSALIAAGIGFEAAQKSNVSRLGVVVSPELVAEGQRLLPASTGISFHASQKDAFEALAPPTAGA